MFKTDSPQPPTPSRKITNQAEQFTATSFFTSKHSTVAPNAIAYRIIQFRRPVVGFRQAELDNRTLSRELLRYVTEEPKFRYDLGVRPELR